MTSSSLRFALVVVSFSLGLACAEQQAQEAPARSPAQDYPPPPPTTSDGQVVGADGVPPGDKLQQGPRVGTDTALAPGWTEKKGALKYDAKERGVAPARKPDE